jgi:putative nucleotidyltransferase with HDIG domain
MSPLPVLIVGHRTRERLRLLTGSRRFRWLFAANLDAARRQLARHGGFPVVIGERTAEPDSDSLAALLRTDCPSAALLYICPPCAVHEAVAAMRAGADDLLIEPLDRETAFRSIELAAERGVNRALSFIYRQNLEHLVVQRTGRLRAATADLERSYDVTLEAMGDALDLRDEETEGHSKRVTAYTIALARAMRLGAGELKTIARGAFLHDIGKIAIPDAILLKPGRLTPEEMDVMRTHPERGYHMIRKIPFLEEAAEIVYTHQEMFDGCGYPRGLCGQEIPLGARIFALADSLDAMTSDRPYRKGRSFAQATAEIERCRGTQFDPEIVDLFLSLPMETWTAIRAGVGRHLHASELVRAAAA